MWISRWLMLVCLLAAIGCGASPPSETVEAPSPLDNAKSILQGVAESGTAGSGVMELQAAADAIRSEDAAKASALEKGMQELSTMQDPAAIKKKAKEILDSL